MIDFKTISKKINEQDTNILPNAHEIKVEMGYHDDDVSQHEIMNGIYTEFNKHLNLILDRKNNHRFKFIIVGWISNNYFVPIEKCKIYCDNFFKDCL